MTKVEVIQYDPQHVKEILEKHPREYELHWSRHPLWKEWLNVWKERGPAYTIVVDGEILLCAGVLIYDQGVGEAWMVISSLIDMHGKTAFKLVREKLDEIIKEYDLKMVQATAAADFGKAHKFLGHLGFEAGETMLLFAKECR